MRWAPGEAVIERLIDDRRLQRVSGAQADGAALLARAHRTAETAQAIATDDPDSAYVLAYDATRQACTALLAHQGLRPTTQGGHYAVEEAMRAQFGDAFRAVGTLRRRRNELEYPAYPGGEADLDEVAEAIGMTRGIIESAERILPDLGIF
jgi:hypothetical protein